MKSYFLIWMRQGRDLEKKKGVLTFIQNISGVISCNRVERWRGRGSRADYLVAFEGNPQDFVDALWIDPIRFEITTALVILS